MNHDNGIELEDPIYDQMSEISDIQWDTLNESFKLAPRGKIVIYSTPTGENSFIKQYMKHYKKEERWHVVKIPFQKLPNFIEKIWVSLVNLGTRILTSMGL